MIARISSAIVPYSTVDRYLDYLCTNRVPTCEVSADLISFLVFKRPVVGYVELLTLTIWRSEKALARFLEGCVETTDDGRDYSVIHMESHVYELIGVT